jgi:formyltetrahydrofolate deformylase
MPQPEFVLTFSCPDRMGLVSSVAAWLVSHDCNIIDSDQFGDRHSHRFFMRVHFVGSPDIAQLRQDFAAVGQTNEMAWQIWPVKQKPNVLILVSKQDHCLVDLLYRTRNGELPINISLVTSNHRDAYHLAAAEDIDFLHLPMAEDDKPKQEARLLQEIRSRQIDFVVLARYMQVLSPEFCAALPTRIINIHHSFLPSFKGARPYHQAHEKGVKLIGATAHYVTDDLDEGPIIEQEIERVDHRDTPTSLAAVGRDIERIVLAKAVSYQAEHRILLNGDKTVVFQ